VKEPHYSVHAHEADAQAVNFVTDKGKAIFIVRNREDHDPNRKVTATTMAGLDAYNLAKAFVEFWERSR
jgi:hypothetical protein